MRYIELTKTERHLSKIMEFVSFKTLKGYPCPFCRDKEVKFEKCDDKGVGFNSDIWLTEIRVSCKTCRRVENYIRVHSNFRENEIKKISLQRTSLQLSEELYLNMEGEEYTMHDQKHKFKLVLPPFSINYLELDKLIEKFEIMRTFS